MNSRTVLTSLQVVFEGGIMDGETRDYPDRDVREVTFGRHREPGGRYLERYERTIERSPWTGRTVFVHVAHEWEWIEDVTCFKRVLLRTGLARPKVKTIGSPV